MATPISLSYNFVGIAKDGVAFSGGMDGSNDYSGSLLGTSATYNGNSYTLGSTSSNNTTNNCVQCLGQSITLSGSYNKIGLLMCAVDGNKTNTSFTVTYSDNSTSNLTQSISDWATPQSYSGETIVVGPMAYRDVDTGGTQSGSFYLFGYTFSVTGSKTLKSLTLPNNSQIFLFAADYINASTSVTLSGISSSGGFGIEFLSSTTYLDGITSSELIGSPQINSELYLQGLPGSESFGVTVIGDRIQLFGTDSVETFGNLTCSVSPCWVYITSHCFANGVVKIVTCQNKNAAILPGITIANDTKLMMYYCKYCRQDSYGLYRRSPFCLP